MKMLIPNNILKNDIARKFLSYFSIILFIVFTFIKLLHHTPWAMEAAHYNASAFLNFDNYIDVITHNGHPIIWWLLLKPFTLLLYQYYPYPMLILNWLLCVSAIIIMWKKAPFSFFFKFIITFSSMFLSNFSIVARNYTIGVLLLFMLAALYNDKLKRPILYSVLLGLTINTSALAAIGAIAFTFIFLFDIILNWKNVNKISLMISAFIFTYFLVFCLYPFFIKHITSFGLGDIQMFIEDFYNPLFIVLFIFVFFYFLYKLLKSKSYKSLFFLIFTFSSFIYLHFFITATSFYHKIFLFVYLILAIWIADYKNIKKDCFDIIFEITFLLVLFTPSLENLSGDYYVQDFSKQIRAGNKYSNSVVITPTLEIIPFIDKIFDKIYCTDICDYKINNLGELLDNKKLEQIIKENKNKDIYYLNTRDDFNIQDYEHNFTPVLEYNDIMKLYKID